MVESIEIWPNDACFKCRSCMDKVFLRWEETMDVSGIVESLGEETIDFSTIETTCGCCIIGFSTTGTIFGCATELDNIDSICDW